MIDREKNRRNQLHGGEDNLSNRTWYKGWECNDDRIRVKLVTENVEGDVVIDLGCADGIMCIELARMNKTAIGVNMNQVGINMALKNLDNEICEDVRKRVTFIWSDIENLKLEKISEVSFPTVIDTILCCETLEHVYDPKEIMEKMKEIGKPNAKVIITVPNRAVKDGYMARWELRGIHIREFTKETLNDLLKDYLNEITFYQMYGEITDSEAPFLICSGRLK